MKRETITKTQIIAGLRCPTRLLRMAHGGSPATSQSVAAHHGNTVQEKARSLIHGGVLVGRSHADSDPIATTTALMADKAVQSIFEAGIVGAGVEIYADILRREDAGWHLIEVKAATNTTDEHLFDAAIQAYVLESAGHPLGKVTLQFINVEANLPDAGRAAFAYENVTDECRALYPAVKEAITKCRAILAGEFQQEHEGTPCKGSSPCEFVSECEKGWPKYPVSRLPHGHVVAKKLRSMGIFDIRDIPDGILKSSNHIRVRNITRTGEAVFKKKELLVLKNLGYPRHHIDFESVQFPFSAFEGVAPYEQIPFQWSCHTQESNGEVAHKEFLDISGEDPRRKFATSVIEACGKKGPVIVYNATFERRILNELAACFPVLAVELEGIESRLFDLLDVARKGYYHPEMMGSWSLKAILPCLVPWLKYADLPGARNGEMAQMAYLEAIDGGATADDIEVIRQGLLKYCETDSVSMVEIIKVFLLALEN